MERNDLTYHKEIDVLLLSIYMPLKVAVIHSKGHQKRMNEISQGNQLADTVAKRATQRPLFRLLWSGKDPLIIFHSNILSQKSNGVYSMDSSSFHQDGYSKIMVNCFFLVLINGKLLSLFTKPLFAEKQDPTDGLKVIHRKKTFSHNTTDN